MVLIPPLEVQPSTPIVEALLHYASQQRKRFHVPAHAGQAFWVGELALKAQALGLTESLLCHDVTELEGLDVLSTPKGVIAESQALTAFRCGAAYSFYLVNGASVGIHAALMSAFSPGDLILLPRNVHRAVMAGLVMTGLQPAWFAPTWEQDWGLWGAVSVEALEEAYQSHPQAKGVLVTSPTYEGIVSDISAIASWCQARGLTLVVDEAHGSLFGHVPSTPASATRVSGVSAVIQSFHKNAGSLTQSAVLHLPQGSLLSANRVQEALNHLQSTSPNYLLLASLDLSSAWLASEAGQAQRQALWRSVKALRQRLEGLTAFRLLESASGNDTVEVDRLRLYLRHAYVEGDAWAEELEEHHGLSFELANPYGALYLCQVGNQPTDFVALMKGIQAFGKAHPLHHAPQDVFPRIETPELPSVEVVLSPRDAFFHPQERVTYSPDLIGRISGQTVVACPPGVPVLLTGERIQAEHLPFLGDQSALSVLTQNVPLIS